MQRYLLLWASQDHQKIPYNLLEKLMQGYLLLWVSNPAASRRPRRPRRLLPPACHIWGIRTFPFAHSFHPEDVLPGNNVSAELNDTPWLPTQASLAGALSPFLSSAIMTTR